MARAKLRRPCRDTRNDQKRARYANFKAAGDVAALRKFTEG
jgi:hypothetical protein